MLNNLSQVEKHDYSDNLFIGVVVYNQDPLKLGRVKCTVPKLYEGDHTQLPWIAPMFMGFVANIPGNSGHRALVPGIGAELTIELQMGSPLHGLYTASPLRPNSVLAEFDANYLGKYGWKDPAGNIFIVDTTSGQNTIRLFHASGAELKIVNNGDTTYETPGKLDATIQGDVTLTTPSSVQATVGGDVNFQVTGNFIVNAANIYLNES